MEFNFWGKNCEDGESFVIGEDSSDMMTIATLTGKSPATVSVNGNTVACVTPDAPNAHLKQRLPYDESTRIDVTGSTVDICGYSASFDIDKALEKMVMKKRKRAAEKAPEAAKSKPAASKSPVKSKSPAKSPKQAATKSPKQAATKKSPKSTAQKATKKAPEAVELSMADVMDITGVDMDDQQVDVGTIVLNGKEYFIDYKEFKLYSGTEEDATFAGFYHPKTKSIEQTPPDHTLDDSAVLDAAINTEKDRIVDLRNEWLEEHPDADSDGEVTIDSYVPFCGCNNNHNNNNNTQR